MSLDKHTICLLSATNPDCFVTPGRPSSLPSIQSAYTNANLGGLNGSRGKLPLSKSLVWKTPSRDIEIK
ncbi:hypothetical protein ACET3Z_006445 [Daucus carota]